MRREQAAWRIRGAGGAAQRLGLKPTTLESRMEKSGCVAGSMPPVYRSDSEASEFPPPRHSPGARVCAHNFMMA